MGSESATAISSAIDSGSSNQARSRSHSISTQILSSVNKKIKEIEDADSTRILQYMDDQVHETWDCAKAAMIGAQRLLQFHELPKEWQENEYILSGWVEVKKKRSPYMLTLTL